MPRSNRCSAGTAISNIRVFRLNLRGLPHQATNCITVVRRIYACRSYVRIFDYNRIIGNTNQSTYEGPTALN